MNPNDITLLIQNTLPTAHIQVTSDDNRHFQASITSPTFQGKSRIQQHQMVYDIINPYIKSGEIHAISLKTQV